MNKIDFAGIITVRNANPNGDPLSGNRPRVNYESIGEISDVCLKRKLRNRLQDFGERIFVQSDDRCNDGYPSLRRRAEGNVQLKGVKDKAQYSDIACRTWFDVRAFGQVFAYEGEGKGKGVSVGIRGPVTVQPAFSMEPVDITSIQITKSVSGDGDGTKRSSDTMGMKHRVDRGVYVFYGSINPQLAERTGFDESDANKIKEALRTLFENDCSAARPEGSMEMANLVWWAHDCSSGQYGSAKVHRSLKVVRDEACEHGFRLDFQNLEGLAPEVL